MMHHLAIDKTQATGHHMLCCEEQMLIEASLRIYFLFGNKNYHRQGAKELRDKH